MGCVCFEQKEKVEGKRYNVLGTAPAILTTSAPLPSSLNSTPSSPQHAVLESNIYGDVDHSVYQPPVNVFRDSEVLDSEQQLVLSELLSVNRQYSYRLCYRGSMHGWSSLVFHSRCDSKGKTVTVARTTAASLGGPRVFGGFAGSSWHTSGSWIFNYDSFLFRFTEEGGFERTDSVSSTSTAQYGHPAFCPRFGNGDLIIQGNCKMGSANPSSFS